MDVLLVVKTYMLCVFLFKVYIVRLSIQDRGKPIESCGAQLNVSQVEFAAVLIKLSKFA